MLIAMRDDAFFVGMSGTDVAVGTEARVYLVFNPSNRDLRSSLLITSDAAPLFYETGWSDQEIQIAHNPLMIVDGDALLSVGR
jgi:hypothetical protein